MTRLLYVLWLPVALVGMIGLAVVYGIVWACVTPKDLVRRLTR